MGSCFSVGNHRFILTMYGCKRETAGTDSLLGNYYLAVQSKVPEKGKLPRVVGGTTP
jgi:hypothetical protein